MCWANIVKWFTCCKYNPSEKEVIENTIENEGGTTTETPGEGQNLRMSISLPGGETEVIDLPVDKDNVEVCFPVDENMKYVVLLDNGHASSTPGKRSPKLDDGTQFFEYEFTRDIVARLKLLLEEAGIRYEIITPEVDKDIAISTRAARANEYCKKYGKENCLFISVHANAYGMGESWEKPEGWSIYTCKGETRSDEIAKFFYEEAEKIIVPSGYKMRDGSIDGNPGPDYEADFVVLKKTSCPAILTENMFYTNKKDVKWLMSEAGRDDITQIHFNGILRWLEDMKEK